MTIGVFDMKRVGMLILFLSFSVSVFGQAPCANLEGTWEMIDQKLIYPDSTVDRGNTVEYTIKVLNQTHFAFGRQIADGEEAYAGGGRYTVDGDQYVEHIMYHSSAPNVGLSVAFDCRVDGDTWLHEGDIGDFRLVETWRRIK